VVFIVEAVSVTVGGVGVGVGLSAGGGVGATELWLGDGDELALGGGDGLALADGDELALGGTGVADVATEGTGVSDVAGPRTTSGGRVESFDTVITANTIAASKKTPRPPAKKVPNDR
jgi:hypothetical protein